MKYLIATFATLVLASFPAQAQEESKEFVKKAAVSNKFEIMSSELAVERAQNTAVREFAQHMIKDHGKAAKDLTAAVEKSELGVEAPDTLDEKHKEMMQALRDTSGEQFEQKYIELQMAAHDEAVGLFEDFAENDDASPPLRKFAENTLPVLKEHDRHVQQLDQQVAER